jgi:hypothetical protein
VRLDQTVSIFIDDGSTLVAEGKSDSTIVFTRSGGFGYWGTIAGVGANMSFQHCLIEWGRSGFFQTLHDGMVSNSSGSTVIEDCTLQNSGLDATEFPGGTLVFRRNVILDAARQGYNSWLHCMATVEDNRVERCANGDAYDISEVDEGELIFRNNIAIDIGDDGLDIDDWLNGTVTIGYFEAYNVGDKGVSVSLNSNAVIVENMIIVNANEAYTVTNNSNLFVNNCVAYGCNRGFSAYQRNPPYNGGNIQVAGSITWNTAFERVFVDTFSTASILYSILDTNEPWPGPNPPPNQIGFNNLNINPNFLRPELNDFRLRFDSPAIDAGWSDAMPPTDIRGNPRVDHPGVPDTGAPPPLTYYDIGAHEFDPTVTAVIPGMGVPPVAGFGLRAFPSPTFGKVDIDFELAQGRQVEVGIYDAAGRLVRRVFTGPLGAGRHTLDWDGGGARARSGLYFIRLRAGNEEQVERLVRIH